MKKKKERESFDTYMELMEYRRQKKEREEFNKRLKKAVVAFNKRLKKAVVATSETLIYSMVFSTLGYNIIISYILHFFLGIKVLLLVLIGNIVILAIMAHSFFKNFEKYDEDK